MSIQQWATVAAVKGIIKSAPTDGKVDGLVKSLSDAISAFFPGDEAIIKQMLVESVILPLAKGLSPDGYKTKL